MAEQTAITTITKFQESLAEYKKKKFNILLPVMQIQSIPEMHELVLSVVKIDPDPKNKEVYKYQKNIDLSLTMHGIDKVAAAAGVCWNWKACKRVDDGREPHYCVFMMEGWAKDFDGTWRNIVRHREVDLRDGSEQIQDFASTAQLQQARKNILSLAQSKAANRVLRSLLFLKHGYSIEELNTPFIVPKLVFRPDLSDPVVKQAYVLSQLQGPMQMLYGGQPASPKIIEPALLIEPEGTMPEPANIPYEELEGLSLEEEALEAERQFKNLTEEEQIYELKRIVTLTKYPKASLKKPLEQFSTDQLLGFWHKLQELLPQKGETPY